MINENYAQLSLQVKEWIDALIHRYGMRLESPEDHAPAIPTVAYDNLHFYVYRALLEKYSSVMCCVHLRVCLEIDTPHFGSRIQHPELVCDDDVTLANCQELLFCPYDLAVSVLQQVEAQFRRIKEKFYRSALETFQGKPIYFISKMISVLMPLTYDKKEYFDMIVYGAERLGKTSAILLALLVAASTEMLQYI